MAFLPSLGFLGFEIHIFYCNTPCLVWLPIQHRRKPISREPDFSVQKQGFLDGFLVRWEEAPGSFPAAADNIGNPVNFLSGLAVLSIEYSDGSHGILVVSCHGAGTPDTVFEGITASKDFVDYWNRVPPSGTPTGPNANRTSFHIVQRERD